MNPAQTLAIADVSFRELPLTLTLSRGKREQQQPRFGISCNSRFAYQLTMILPLLGERDGVRAASDQE
jgi:hypothetical protein